MIQSIPDGKHHVPDYHFSLIEQSDLCNQYVRLWTQMTNQHTNKSTAVECYSWCFFIWIYILASLCALNVQLSCGHMSQTWVCVCVCVCVRQRVKRERDDLRGMWLSGCEQTRWPFQISEEHLFHMDDWLCHFLYMTLSARTPQFLLSTS